MALLTMKGISKSFFGVPVLAGVDLTLEAGEVHAVVGENGAGKSTLMKVLAGVYAPDAGTIEIDGRPVAGGSFAHPSRAQAAGVAIIYQELTLLPERTVAENVFLGREPTRRGLIDRAAMDGRATRLLAELEETSFGSRTPVRDLPVARQQVVEIVKALATDARILIMDEPTAALADHEVELLYALVRRLAERGLGILYVSHRLREVFDLAQRITVLKDGRLVTEQRTADTGIDQVVRAMVGRELSTYYPDRAAPGEVGLPRLTVTGGGNARLSGVDLELRAGEVVGVAGLQGSGRTSLARALFGADPFTAGQMRVDGAALRPTAPRQAIHAGIALVTEDRKAEGLALRQSVHDNTLLVARAVPAAALRAAARGPGRAASSLVALVAGSRRSAVQTPPARSLRRKGVSVGEVLERVQLRARGHDQPVRYLSGGNQQKVVIAKWLGVRPRILIFDEPTRGVDVGAKAAIHDLVRRLARDGMAVLIISSELPELIGMSDRVLIMRAGSIAGELPAGPTEEDIMRLATGGSAGERGDD